METLSPSILAADILNLGAEIKKVEKSGAQYVHLDIMDGCFVPNISFGMPIISGIRRCTDLILDVHLMIVKPNRYIDELVKCGADIITFHLEALEHDEILNAIEKIHGYGKRVGISVKPKTSFSELKPYIGLVDMVLIMTVEPGFGGQKFMHETMEKVTLTKEYAKTIGKSVDIEVDGGINKETLKIAKEAGANIFVLGTAFFASDEDVIAEEIINGK